jgi:hypothetical protein
MYVAASTPIATKNSKDNTTMNHCCDRMREAAENVCDEHPDRFDCPDCLVSRFLDGRYGLIIHDGGSSVVIIRFCPWCGTELPSPSAEEP